MSARLLETFIDARDAALEECAAWHDVQNDLAWHLGSISIAVCHKQAADKFRSLKSGARELPPGAPKVGDVVGDRMVIRVFSDGIIFGRTTDGIGNFGAWTTDFEEWFAFCERVKVIKPVDLKGGLTGRKADFIIIDDPLADPLDE